MDVGMVDQGAGPGVQDTEQAKRAAQVTGIGSQGQQRPNDVITKASPNNAAAQKTKAAPSGAAFDFLYCVAV